jgi:hypothetical protein
MVIESTGISEPMPVAATCDWEFDDVAALDTTVTVVDASTFMIELAKGEALTERQLAAGDGHARSIADLLVDQPIPGPAAVFAMVHAHWARERIGVVWNALVVRSACP